MFKSKPLMMLISGLLLALTIWAVGQVLQNKPLDNKPAQQNSEQEKLEGTTTPTETLSTQGESAPASILSAVQSGTDISIDGIGVPGSEITLLNDGKEFVKTKVSDNGNWHAKFVFGIDYNPITIDVLTITPDGYQVRADQSLFVINHQHDLEMETTDPKKALLLLTAPGAHSRVLQTPYLDFPRKSGFALEAIDYDNSGGVIFSGSSEQAGRVLIYAGKNLVGESRVDSQGRWSLIFGSIMPMGAYDISAELIVENENPVSITLPFERMQPLFSTEGSPKIVIEHLEGRIQIARALFGGGYQYSVVYSPTELDN